MTPTSLINTHGSRGYRGILIASRYQHPESTFGALGHHLLVHEFAPFRISYNKRTKEEQRSDGDGAEEGEASYGA